MNKIFKVIWSKSKQCYVVVSEMAKNKTGKKKIVVAGILAALAMQTAGVTDVEAAPIPGDLASASFANGTVGSGKTNGLAIGNASNSGSNQSIAIGYFSEATAPEVTPAALPATAVGAGAKAIGYSTVALGLSAQAKADSATALGSKTSATGDRSVAVGINAAATADSATALGSKTSATGDRTVAVGSDAKATGRYASTFGADASAVGNATAVGANSLASVDAAVAVGTDSKATGNYASALGAGATASDNESTAFGHGTVASGSSSTALGSRAKAGGVAGVGIGMLANATNQYGVAIGGESSSSADNSIAIGRKSSVTGENGIAIGAFTTSKGANGVAVGTNGTTAVLGGVAVGQAAKANKFTSVAMGMNVTADGDNSVALGGSASANSDGTIAIGSYGSTPTKATGNRALAIGSATTANGLESIAIGSRVNSTSQHSIAIGTRANASAVKSVAIGPDSRVTVDGGVALGRDSVANVIGGVTNKGYNPNTNRTDIYSGLTGNVLTSTTGAVSIGNGSTVTRQLTGLAAGTKDTDAVNVAQLKSVNLAFSGNVNTGNVNIANSTLGLKGDNTYITTAANGQNLTISGKTQNINVTNGQASANAAGMADSKNVADAINKAISANAYSWKVAAANDSNGTVDVNKNDTVIFNGDNNISVTRNGKQINSALNKNLTVESVNASKKITVASGGNGIVLDGSNGAVTGRSFTGDSFKAGNNVLSNTTLQMGLPSSAKNVTISGDGLTAKNGTRTVKFGTDGISAGGQQITNVSSGGNVGTNAANITDVKNAVAAVTLNLDTNSKTGTVKLSESPLKVIGANGIRTDLLGTNNGSLVVGLDKNTVNATTKGIGLTGDTESTGLKYLKDGDATFKVAGDGNLVTTKASATGVQVAVDSAKVKDLAVGAVIVSKANTADNPITITPTAGTNTKDYAIGIDTTKLANQTQLTYKANGTNANKVSLANGLNFTDGTFTKATVGTNGTVTISTATETITNDADGKAKVNSPTDGLATAKNVADSINKAVDGLSQNLTVSDGTTDGTVNLKNQKLTVSGTNGVSTTVNGQTVTVGLDAATKTKVDNASTAVARNISLGADSGTASSQSLKDGDVAFNVKAATGDLVSTKMNGNTVEISTKRAAITSDANTGAASVTGDDGLATSKNVADAINKAADAAKAGAAWNLTTNSSTTDKTTVQGGDTVDLINGDNILITQDGTDKKKITVATKKDLTVDSITAGNTVMNTSGLTNGTTAITGTGITTDKVTVGGISIDKTDGINGGNKTITNVASGGTTDTNAANIGDVKQAVANLSQNLNITDGTNNGTIDLKNQKLNVAGTNGVTATVNGQTVTVGLDDNTVNATTKGIGLTGDTGSTGNKYLKDGDVSFAVTGDGNLVSTSATSAGVKVAVDTAKVKDLAVAAVTVSKDAQADNPITVTPTAGTNSKDYAIGIDTTKLATKTDLTYRANSVADANAKKVSLSKGLDFVNGTLTTASVDNDGVVKYDVNTAAITAGADGTITGPTTDGVATAKNVVDAINAAKKASKTEIAANTGEAANATKGNVTLTSTTAADGHTIYDVKLNDKVTLGSGVNAVTIDGTTGAITGKTATIGGVTVNGTANTIGGLSNTTWNGTAVSGRAATEDQLQIVADKVGAGWNVNSGKVTGSTGEANGSAKTNVASGEEVQLQAGNNLIIDQNGKTLAYSLNKNLKDMESATFNATGGKTTVIKGDSIVQTDGGKTNTSNAAGNTVIDGTKTTATTAAGTTITDGANTNTSTATSNTLKNTAGDETKVDAKGATVKDAAGNTTNVASTGATVTNAAGDTTKVEATGTTVTDTAGNKATFTKDGVTITKPGKDTVSLTGNGLDNGNNKIVNVADGTAAKDAVNVSQLNAKTKAATTELTANGGQSAGNTTGNIVLTKTTAADGHTVYDNKLNDKITLGAADPTKAITVDGIAGTITAGKDGNAVAIDGTNGTVKAGDGKNAVAIDGVNGSVKVADKITLNGKDGKAGVGTVGIDGKDGIITTGGTNPIAVNGKDGVVTGLTNKAWDPNNITSGRAATEDQIKSAVANAGWNAAVGSEGSGVNSTPTATAEKIKPNETVTFKAGNNMMVSQVGKTISYAVNPELTDMKSATFKDAAGNTTVTNGNGMTITPGSANPNNPNAGPVSLTKDGLNNGNNQIKGVAPGTDPTDAANVSQLQASNANTSQAINQVAGEVQRVGAHAAAMAALKPIQYDPLEPTQVMAGVGNYRGETAAALGLAHYTNENTMFNIGVSVGGNHNMVNAGVTHKFGYSPEKKNIPDRYKAGPISSVYVMQDEVSSLKKENAEQKYVIADQAARLNSLEAENERQRRELAETKQGLDDLRAAVDKLLASKG